MTPKKKSEKPVQELTSDEVMERILPKKIVKILKQTALESLKTKGKSSDT